MRAMTPMLNVRGAARAIEFYRDVFDAVEVTRIASPDGTIGHAELRIDGAPFDVADEWPEGVAMGWVHSPAALGGSTVILLVYVSDVDRVFARAVAAGAQAITPPEDQRIGRCCRVKDPFGHLWMIANK
jgi:PhnB protein